MNPLVIRRYVKNPLGLWYKLKKDIPLWIQGKDYYSEMALRYPSTPHTPKPIDSEVSFYLSNREKRKASTVIYTCITNGYDDLWEIANPSFINHDADYVCYTDDKEYIRCGRIGVWEIRPLAFTESDNTRNNRWHKLHPHVLFPEYEASIYIDANVDILSAHLFSSIYSKKSPIVIPIHPTRTCIYQEYELILAEIIDDPRRVVQELKTIRRSKMPKNYGLTENNIIYRRHNDSGIVSLMEDWWSAIVNYARRDQLSLAWILWKHGITISKITIPNARFQKGDYTVFAHIHNGNSIISPNFKSQDAGLKLLYPPQ